MTETIGLLDQLTSRTLVLVDANCMLYRAWHSLTHREDFGESGPPEGLVAYSFMSQVRSAITSCSKGLNPLVLFVWDPPDSKEEKLLIHPTYKGGRKKNDAINRIRENLRTALFNVRERLSISFPRCEADDIIGIIVRRRLIEANSIIIMSRDEDLLQMLNEKTSYYNPFSKKIITMADFHKAYGFSPERISIYKAIAGDDSDNWKGLAGKGPAFAKKIVSRDCSDRDLVTDFYNSLDPVNKERFLVGLNLCRIPWTNINVDDVVSQLESMLSAEQGPPSWDGFYHRFDIRDRTKVHIQIGSIR